MGALVGGRGQGCTPEMGSPTEHKDFWDRNLQFKELDFADFEDDLCEIDLAGPSDSFCDLDAVGALTRLRHQCRHKS
eukprot:9454333-Pyramimonas_sp.AAC.1